MRNENIFVLVGVAFLCGILVTLSLTALYGNPVAACIDMTRDMCIEHGYDGYDSVGDFCYKREGSTLIMEYLIECDMLGNGCVDFCFREEV